MPTQNDFLPFAAAGGANVLTQSQYLALSTLANGFTGGIAASVQLNKVWRQSSIMASLLGQFIVDYAGQSAIDDGTIATLETNFALALKNASGAGTPLVTDTGSAANSYVGANAPALTGLVNGMTQRLIVGHTNTGASTYTMDAQASKPIYGLAGISALAVEARRGVAARTQAGRKDFRRLGGINDSGV